MRRASVCGFLHEANVAVDFSFSLLSLCDIVYWETNKQKNIQMWTKKNYFKRGYCDTVCYRHLSWSSWRACFFSLPSSFFSFQKRSSLSSLMLTLGKLCLLFSTFSSFSTMLGKRACLCDTLQNLLSPLWRQESCWGSPRGTVIHTTQEIPSDQSIDASRPRSHHTAQLSSSACSCVCVCVCFVCEKKPGAHTHFLQIIKAQNQSPHPLIYFVRLFRKASLCYSVSFCTGVWVCYCVCVSVL